MATYTSFEALSDYTEDHAFFKPEIQFLKDGIKAAMADEDWTVAFKALDDLRVANKFHANDLAENLDFLAPMVKAAVENLRSNISKNALTFCKELFMNSQISNEGKYLSQMIIFTQAIIPSLLHKTQTDKVFISKEAKEAVNQCMISLPIPETLAVLTSEGLKNK